jgi:benzoate/toluate 1,2-dioxygenase reductase subunit
MTEAVRIKLLFSDGVVYDVPAQSGQSVVEAASAAGLSLLTDCSNGQCGTCVAQCVAGAVSLGDYDSAVLPDEDREDGAILCCVTHAQADAVIELPYESSEASAGELPSQMGQVVSVSAVADEIYKLVVRVPQAVDFLAGQYVRLRPEGESCWRSYSMANETGQTELEFYVRVVAGGAFSQWVTTQAKPGASIEVGAPRGSFFLRDEDAPTLLVAGGTGLAPILAMLHKIRDADTHRDTPVRVLIGARSGAHLFAQAQLQAVQEALPHVHIDIACEDQAPEGCHQGYATDLITADTVLPDTRIYLCGPPAMVEAGRAAASKAGVSKSRVLCECFN